MKEVSFIIVSFYFKETINELILFLISGSGRADSETSNIPVDDKNLKMFASLFQVTIQPYFLLQILILK